MSFKWSASSHLAFFCKEYSPKICISSIATASDNDNSDNDNDSDSDALHSNPFNKVSNKFIFLSFFLCILHFVFFLQEKPSINFAKENIFMSFLSNFLGISQKKKEKNSNQNF